MHELKWESWTSEQRMWVEAGGTPGEAGQGLVIV